MYLYTTAFIPATAILTSSTPTRAAALPLIDDLSPLLTGDSQLQRWSSLIGIVTAIVGNILISFALNIQRYAHIRLHEERSQRKEKSRAAIKGSHNGYGSTISNGIQHGEHSTREGTADDELQQSFHSGTSQSTAYSEPYDEQESSYLKSPYWWGGIVLMTVGEAGNFLAYGFAPASIVSPLGVVALISNCVIAPIMLKERFRLRDFWGVVVAVAGAVTVVLSAKQEEKKLGPHEILDAVTTTAFEVYMGVTIFLIGVLMWASPRYGSKTILVDLGLVGLFGGYTALSTKGVASMLSFTLWRALTTPVTYVLVAVLIATAVMQVKYVNKALQRFDSTQVIPVQFVMFTLSVIIGSAILYRDFEKASAENLVKFVGGCLLTFFGVWLITSGRSSTDGQDDNDESDEEGDLPIDLSQQDSAEAQPSDVPSRKASTVNRTSLHRNGDSANDVLPEHSRRLSHVSFADTSQSYLPRAQSRSSSRGQIRVVTSVAYSDIPSNTEETPLLTNPWKVSSDDSTVGHNQPLREAHSSVSGEPPKPPNNRASTQGTLHTHPNLQQSPALPHADRPYTPTRHSMLGPLMSPLSGGLSVVIADSLRRGVESPIRVRPSKRSRLGLRRSKSGSQRLTLANDELEEGLGTSTGSALDTAQEFSKSLEPERGNWSGLTRGRSLSNTLGELLRGKRQPAERFDIDDEEAGPSGS